MKASASHLPPGHEPGPQTRRAKRGGPIGGILMVLFSLGFLGGAIALFLSRNSGGHRSSKEVGAAVFLAIAVMFLLLGYWLLRRALTGGRRLRGVSLELPRTEYSRGERLDVTVRATGADQQLEVGLLCTQFTDVKRQTVDANGNTNQVRAIDSRNVIEQWQPLAASSPSQSFTFTLPADAPFSYEGATVSWAYLVAVREPRSLRTDPHNDVPIWVSP